MIDTHHPGYSGLASKRSPFPHLALVEDDDDLCEHGLLSGSNDAQPEVQDLMDALERSVIAARARRNEQRIVAQLTPAEFAVLRCLAAATGSMAIDDVRRCLRSGISARPAVGVPASLTKLVALGWAKVADWHDDEPTRWKVTGDGQLHAEGMG